MIKYVPLKYQLAMYNYIVLTCKIFKIVKIYAKAMVFLLTVKSPMIQVVPSRGCKKIAALIRRLYSKIIIIIMFCPMYKLVLNFVTCLAILVFSCCLLVSFLSVALYIFHRVAINIKVLICDE